MLAVQCNHSYFISSALNRMENAVIDADTVMEDLSTHARLPPRSYARLGTAIPEIKLMITALHLVSPHYS